MTRNNIIGPETIQVRKIIQLSLDIQQFLMTGGIGQNEYNISIKYNEFANPSFENQIQILGSAWVNGEISTEKYVDLLWGDKISDEEKAAEVAWLDQNKKDLGDEMGLDLSALSETAEAPARAENEVYSSDLQDDTGERTDREYSQDIER